ncbi:MAG: J domain-containing protein [Pseudomonadota bacterium]
MAKIHTHYDNLKVARLAPQEVIRAAYKALSQKYHPDKNPGDDKAARIMAILNSAYGTLSDPVRRKEHDDWIAAEEWEIDWLESTRGDEPRSRNEPPHAWPEQVDAARSRYRVLRDPRWWLAIGFCFAAGTAAGVMLMGQPKVLPVALAQALGGKAEPRPDPARLEVDGRNDALLDTWAVSKPQFQEAPGGQASDIKALAVTQLVVPARAPDCDAELHTLASPNGEPWPSQTGYVEGYPIGNRGEEMRLVIDNGANASPIFAKVYDLDRRSNVRHLFVAAHETMEVEKLAAGKYEVRYQNVEVGSTKAECIGRKQRPIKQAAADAG